MLEEANASNRHEGMTVKALARIVPSKWSRPSSSFSC